MLYHHSFQYMLENMCTTDHTSLYLFRIMIQLEYTFILALKSNSYEMDTLNLVSSQYMI